MSTALHSVGLLAVVSTTTPVPSVARLVSTPVSTASRRTMVRNSGFVVDASVAVKWFVDEQRSTAARAVLETGQPIIAPDLIVPESGNTAWKKVRRGEISREQAEAMVQALPLSFDRLVATAPLSPRALQIALRFGHPTYDCFYVALAEDASAPLVTDDRRVIGLAKQAGLGKLVKPLAAFERRSK